MLVFSFYFFWITVFVNSKIEEQKQRLQRYIHDSHHFIVLNVIIIMNITTLKDNNIHIAIFHCPYICCKNSTSKHTETKNGTNLANKAFRSSYFFFYFGSLNLISESTTSKKVMRSYVEVFLMARENPLSLWWNFPNLRPCLFLKQRYQHVFCIRCKKDEVSLYIFRQNIAAVWFHDINLQISFHIASSFDTLSIGKI